MIVTAAFSDSPASAQAGQAQSTLSDADKEAGEAEALMFVERLDSGDLGELYDEELGPVFKALMAKPNFIQQGSFQRLQSGGPAVARELVGSQPFTQTPTGQTGNFLYVRYRTRHPNGLVFQDIYVEKLDTGWKVVGVWTLPAPQQ